MKDRSCSVSIFNFFSITLLCSTLLDLTSYSIFLYLLEFVEYELLSMVNQPVSRGNVILVRMH